MVDLRLRLFFRLGRSVTPGPVSIAQGVACHVYRIVQVGMQAAMRRGGAHGMWAQWSIRRNVIAARIVDTSGCGQSPQRCARLRHPREVH